MIGHCGKHGKSVSEPSCRVLVKISAFKIELDRRRNEIIDKLEPGSIEYSQAMSSAFRSLAANRETVCIRHAPLSLKPNLVAPMLTIDVWTEVTRVNVRIRHLVLFEPHPELFIIDIINDERHMMLFASEGVVSAGMFAQSIPTNCRVNIDCDTLNPGSKMLVKFQNRSREVVKVNGYFDCLTSA